MRVWAVANQKGGVGKTTTAVTLGGLLAEQGHRVLLLDLDPHGSMTSYFGYDPDHVANSSYQIFQFRAGVDEEEVMALTLDTCVEAIKLIPASPALATLERQMTGQEGMGLRVAKALAQCWDHFDYCLIDSPPVLGVLMINALAACEQLLIPVQTEFLAIKGLERMTKTLSMVMQARKQPLNYTVIPTMFDRRTQASVSSLNTLRNNYERCIWRSVIPVDTRFRDASKNGVPPSIYDPQSRGARAYSQLLKHLLGAEEQRLRA